MSESPQQQAAAVSIAAIILRACAIEGARERLGQAHGVRITQMSRPGTMIWIDPSTGEERYSAPGDPMYSTALMLAQEFIGPDGERQAWL